MSRRSKGPKRPVHRHATRKGGHPRGHQGHRGPDRLEDQELIRDLRRVLRSGEPLAVAQFVSAIAGRFTRSDPAATTAAPPPPIGLAEFVDTFIDVRIAETTAALHVFAALLEDELTVRRIRRELTDRTHPMPDDVTGLADLRVTGARLLLDPLGDGVDVLLGLAGPGVRQATFLVYVDANLGGIVKDAFVVPDSISGVEGHLLEISAREGSGAEFIDLSPADARATLEHGIAAYDDHDRGAPSSDSWPNVRALLAMVTRTLPTGGSIPEEIDISPGRWFELDDDELDAREEAEYETAHDFLASPAAAHLTGHDEIDHEIAHLLSSFATAVGIGDPLRWSPPTVEIALDQTLPVMLSGDPDEYARVPTVLRAFIRFAHAEREVSPELTLQTLAVVDTYEEAFFAKRDHPAIVAARAQMAAAFAAIAADSERPWMEQKLLDELGSTEAIDTLTDEPLPDEPLDLTSVPEDIHERVCRVAGLVESVTDEFYDVEFRTACRRLLTMVATNDPAIFRRRSKDETAAAAIVWIIGQANDAIGGHRGLTTIGEMMEFLGLKPGTPSQRAEPMLRAIGINPHRMYAGVVVGTPRLLTSQARAALLRFRDA